MAANDHRRGSRNLLDFDDTKDDDDFKENGNGNNGTPRKRNPKKTIIKRPSHLTDVSTKEKHLENDDAIKEELLRIEASDDSTWSHPMGFNLLSALRILNAPADPILNNTGYWIQPEELEDIPAMFDSYLNVNCLYYSLVGVLAIETSLWLPIPPEDAPEYAKWLITISRFCWAANGVWSMSAVVASFHILWCVYATPSWARRRFVFDNSRTISIVYAMGAPNFFMMLVGTITGVMGNVVTQYGFTKMDTISTMAGLGLGCTVTAIFVLCSGSLIAKVIRPWKVADENIRKQQQSFAKTAMRRGSIDEFFGARSNKSTSGSTTKQQQTDYSNEDNNMGMGTYDIDEAGFGSLQMPFIARKLCAAELDMDMLRRVNDEVLLERLLKESGVNKAGDRLKIILFIRDHPSDNIVRASIIGSGDF